MIGSYFVFKLAGAGIVSFSGIKIGSKLKKRLLLRKNILAEYIITKNINL